MGRKWFFLSVFFVLGTLYTYAQTGPSSFDFVENKGQWHERVKYKGEFPGGAFFLEQQGFTVLLHHPEDLDAAFGHHHQIPGKTKTPKGKLVDKPANKNVVRSHAYTVRFRGANTQAAITPEKPLQSYNNYFIGNDPAAWATGVKLYQAILYKSVYPGIDVRYYSENGRLKYDFIVHPGGDPGRIELEYAGADALSVKNKELIVKTSVGEVKELYPYSYQYSASSAGRKEVSVQYSLSAGNIVRFNVRNYDRSSTLIIDPALIFASFTGSSANQYGFTATPGPDGSLYSGGIVFGPGFPTTPGAFQSSFQGGQGSAGKDISIMKFSPNGSQRLYATYLGGSGNDYPHSLFCDPQGNLVVMGRSYSANYPGQKVGVNGSSDIVVTKLNANGTALIGSLKIGGSGADGYNIFDMQEADSQTPNSLMQNYGDDSRSEVILDNNNNIYIAGQSQSSNFPVTANAFQNFNAGKQDGVILKIDPDCQSVIWASYLGGAENDGAFVLALNPQTSELYVAGATASDDFPGNKTNVISQNYQGDIADGFVTIISNDGRSQGKTTFLGTNRLDIVYGIQFDRRGFPYVMGITHGSWFVINNPYSNPNSKQFVAKLQPDLSAYIFSTVFGSGSSLPNMSPVAFLVDRCENLYISGWGKFDNFPLSGVNGMPITDATAIKSRTDNNDFYFIVIERDARSLLFGSYFGQDGGYPEHVDGGTSRFDPEGVIYMAICANCRGGANFPTSPGVIGPINGALPDGCNLAAVKISLDFAGVGSGPRAFINNVPDTAACAPFTVTFRDTIRNAQQYEWDFGDGSPPVFTTEREVQHLYDRVGQFRVRLIAIDSNACNIRDTAYTTILAGDNEARLSINPVKLPPCESLTYRFDNLSTAPTPFRATSFTWDFGDGTRLPASGPGSVTHEYAGPGTYTVRLILNDSIYCNSPDSIEVELRVAPLVTAQFETPASGCAPYTATFNNTSLGGETFLWNFGDGTTSTETSPTHIYPSPGTYRVSLIARDPQTCNLVDSVVQTISVTALPTADFSFGPIPTEENKPVIFENLSTGAVRYKWLFGDGDSAIRTTRDTVLHQYNATGIYDACLIAYSAAGCADTICKPVEARVIPLLDVPNAFTPGKFGRNSVIRVEGFGIARMTWKIYNRWGQQVFESSSRSVGWDGTFKGELQPMDVYAYTLEVEFSDGTKARKTGDITLIR